MVLRLLIMCQQAFLNTDDMKIQSRLYTRLIAGLYVLVSMAVMGCTDDSLLPSLSQEQSPLLGRKINFNTSVADPFLTRAYYADVNGTFCVGDKMTIYQQYWTDANEFGEESYRQYYLRQKTALGTSAYVGDPNWLPDAGRKGGFWNKETLETVVKEQSEADSLTWENDRTVRFRAVSRSNYANCITGGKSRYYPDFCISDWVTVSGPTTEIPFVMKHLGSRIMFSPRTGNMIQKVEICTTEADYAWNDNAGTKDEDTADKTLPDGMTAAQAAASVKAVYDKMCMPAGVDMETGLMLAMTKAFYNGQNSDFARVNENPIETGTVTATSTANVKYGTQTAADIAAHVQRPVFSERQYGSHLFFVTIPYDMSSGDTQGEVLTLPPYTRFRVWMYDTNQGDGNTTTDQNNSNVGWTEGNYHIFSLSDIAGDTFKDGMEMAAGKSYRFYVGYLYDQLKVEMAKEFSWTEQDWGTLNADYNTPDLPTSTQPYKWWQDAIDQAIYDVQHPPVGQTNVIYNPVFEISNEKEFMEFIDLVNGTAATKTSGLEQAYRTILKPDGSLDSKGYWWYTGLSAQGDTLWTTREAMEEQGYVFYNQYYRSVGDKQAEAREAYLKGPFSFYDSSFNLHFTVKLTRDLDLNDWALESIGKTEGSAFMGAFDGQNHKLANVYMKDEYLFNNIQGADIRNLLLESDHKLSLVNQAKLSNYIVGISLKANCTRSSMANSIIGVDADGRENVSYVVGCIHQGEAGDGMIGKADNLYMYACMETASGITAGRGALLGEYYAPENKFFAHQAAAFVDWGRFMCNYYDTERSPGTYAAGVADTYKPQEYIRGAKSHVLKAVTDYLLPNDMPYNKLNDYQKKEIYGLAAWKAMNYGIYRYNSTTLGESHPCTLHYVNNSTGYRHVYPSLVDGKPTASQYANVLEQNN